MRGAVATALVLVLSGASATTAAAAGTLTRLDVDLFAGGATVAGPDFAGPGRLAWATPGRDGYDVTVANGNDRTVRSVFGATSGYKALELAASAERVVLGLFVEQCDEPENCRDPHTVESQYFAGPLGKELDAQPGCLPFEAPPAVDASGDAIAYMNPCAGGATVHDFSAPATDPLLAFPAEYLVRIAGDFVAVDANAPDPYEGGVSGEIRVYDWRTGDLVYTVQAPTPTRSVFDIEHDGTLVFDRTLETGSTQRVEVDWARPAAPTPHRIADAEPYELRVENDLVALGDAGGHRVLDLAGHELVGTTATFGDFDFDGDHLAWVTQPCEVTAIVTWDLTGAPPTLSGARCPRAKPVRLEQHGRVLRLTLRCHDPAKLGCGGRVDLTLPHRTSFGRARVYKIGSGKYRTLRFRKLSRGIACAIARPGAKADLTIEVQSSRERRARTVRRRIPIRRLDYPTHCPARNEQRPPA
jgi:hypothetical protein